MKDSVPIPDNCSYPVLAAENSVCAAGRNEEYYSVLAVHGAVADRFRSRSPRYSHSRTLRCILCYFAHLAFCCILLHTHDYRVTSRD